MTSASQPDTPTCQSCLYFHLHDPRGLGDCHRFPPSFAGDSSPNEKHHWRHPMVGSGDWCGEYLARPATLTTAAD